MIGYNLITEEGKLRSFVQAPRLCLKIILLYKTALSLMLMNEQEFQSDPYQRVYQYIRRHTAGRNLDEFTFNGVAEGSTQDCLEILLR